MQLRGGVTPFVLYRGVLSDGAWCGDVIFFSVVLAFPAHSALGF